jgi:hypothetical protein
METAILPRFRLIVGVWEFASSIESAGEPGLLDRCQEPGTLQLAGRGASGSKWCPDRSWRQGKERAVWVDGRTGKRLGVRSGGAI